MDFTVSSILSSLLISSVGAGMLIFGKKAQKPIYAFIGLAMCIYPYFITNAWVLWLVTVVLLIPLYTFRHSL